LASQKTAKKKDLIVKSEKNNACKMMKTKSNGLPYPQD
jgi:hypothetical protein